MTPFMAFIIVVWAQANPAAPNDRSAVILKHSFPDKQICETALKERMQRAHKNYGEIKTVTILGDCVPVQP